MKKTLLLFILYLFTIPTGISQSENPVGKITLSVIMPEYLESLSGNDLSKLQTKITQILSSSGLAASGYNHNFVIYPKFAVYDASVVESGMQDITITTCELGLFIKQVDNNVIFASISTPLKGNGKSKAISITNAISRINVKDIEYQKFIEKGKTKIIEYYEAKCQEIISKAESLEKMQDYEQALGLLLSVPEEVDCYSKIQAKSIEIYQSFKEKECIDLTAQARIEFEKNNLDNAYDFISKIDPSTKCYNEAQNLIKANQEKLCKTYLIKAKTSIASNNYNDASYYLMEVNPETSCYSEAQILIKEIETRITEAEKREWEFKKQQQKDAVMLQKQRIDASKEIAKAYYNRTQPTYNYTTIIK